MVDEVCIVKSEHINKHKQKIWYYSRDNITIGNYAMDEFLKRKEELKQRLRGGNDEYRYYRSIYDALSVMVVVTDGNVVFDANHAFAAFFAKMGVDVYREDFVLHDYFEKINKYGYLYEGYQDNRWYITLLTKEKEQYRVVIKEGEISYSFNISLSFFEPLEDIFIITLTDISDLVGYKNALEQGIKSSVKDREESMFMLRQYDRAMDASNLIFKLDLEGNITYVNKSITKALKYGSEEMIGRKMDAIGASSMGEDDFDAILAHASQGKIYKGVIENKDKEGVPHYFDLSFIPLINIEGTTVEYLMIAHEITEVMKAKEAAIQTLEAKTKFFDQVSHELRTPLNAIVNFTDQSLENYDGICQDQETRKMVKMFLERSHKNSEHLLHLINSLLDMAKLSAGKESYEMADTELVSLLKDIYETVGGFNKNSAIEFILDLPDMPVWVVSDQIKMGQILINLISNAFKFTQWGFVEMRLRIEKEECIIEVEDSGIGIPKEKIKSIFDPFAQVGVHDQGTGLGLGIASEYCKGMGMILEVESEEGAGSCFRIRMPLQETL